MKRVIGTVVSVGLGLGLLFGLVAVVRAQEGATPTPIPTITAIPAVTETPPAAEITLTPTLTATTAVTLTPTPAAASAAADIPKVHVVQPGEPLIVIAEQYSTTVEAIQLLNNIENPELVFAGQELLIPGETGDSVPTVYTLQMGDTLTGVAEKFNTSVEGVAVANNIINPAVVYAGQDLVIVSRTGTADPQTLTGLPHLVRPGDTLSALAAAYRLSPLEIVRTNDLAYPYRLYPGQRLRIPGDDVYQYLAGEWVEVRMGPLPVLQGNTTAVYVRNLQAGTPLGRLIGPEGNEISLTFAPYEEGYVALAGVDAFAPAGFYRLSLSGEGVQRPWLPFEQTFVVQDVDYGLQQITITEPELLPVLDPAVRAEEDAFLATIFEQFTPEQQWQGVFQSPVAEPIVTAPYGSDRSYNEGPIEIFHTGTDYAGMVGTSILAPAAGTVVYTGTLELRGGGVVIDHGMGVMSAFYHLNQINVAVGDVVTPSQIIAEGGNSGLSTGPHLHWDVRILGAAVNPIQWTNIQFP